MYYTASGNMKLVYFFIYSYLVIYSNAEKAQQGQFPFPPKYPLPNFETASGSPNYLTPEFHSPTPYFSDNNFPFKLLSSVNGKLQNAYPTAFPIMLSSTLNYGDDKGENKDDKNDKVNKSPPMPSYFPFAYKQANKFANTQAMANRTLSIIPNNTIYKHPIDRMDIKTSSQFAIPIESTTLLSKTQNPASRRMIISAENEKNQELDQKASFHSVHFVSPPNVFMQSTTEPAIPILRLSNEMDLDGSFSYEALGADQTHYVQHSRMENLGTDKEGPIVEGSYSYVGDNGQTYTVHYIADSNGYRATGDHLPVPPPIPEIIQRSIQYNLAEESKSPTLLKSFNDDESDSAPYNSEKNRQTYLTSQHNLFTGRTPEAFSFGFAQGRNFQNNLTPEASSKDPIKTGYEFPEENMKRNINNGPLEPHVTFLASQGTRLPSLNVPQKSSLPQLVNYESGIKNSEQENPKALWRWQYGLNSNADNQNPAKNSISRSFGEGDDIIINFGDMTPEQYTKMIQNQMNSNYDVITQLQTKNSYNFDNNYDPTSNSEVIRNNNTNNINYHDKTNIKSFEPAETIKFNRSDSPYPNIDYNYYNNHSQKDEIMKSREKLAVYAVQNIPDTFMPTTELAFQAYNDDNTSFGAKKATVIPKDEKSENNYYYQNDQISYRTLNSHPNSIENNKSNELELNFTNIQPVSTIIPIEYNNNIEYQEENKLIPLSYTNHQEKNVIEHKKEPEVTQSDNIKEAIRNNIFLKNLFQEGNNEPQKYDFKKDIDVNIKTLAKTLPKSVYNGSSSITYKNFKLNEKTRQLDMSDVLNYMSNKNLFESNRIKILNRPISLNNINQNHGIKIDSAYDTKREESKDYSQKQISNNLRHTMHPQEQELRGIIKNYKILQRNNIRNPYSEKDNQLQNLTGSQNKHLHSFNLPPLGRAGPSTKSYLPPTYL